MNVSALRRLSRARMHLVELRRPRRAPVSTGGESRRTRNTTSDDNTITRIRLDTAYLTVYDANSQLAVLDALLR